MTRPIPLRDLVWLLTETPTGTGHVVALADHTRTAFGELKAAAANT